MAPMQDLHLVVVLLASSKIFMVKRPDTLSDGFENVRLSLDDGRYREETVCFVPRYDYSVVSQGCLKEQKLDCGCAGLKNRYSVNSIIVNVFSMEDVDLKDALANI
jgi:hypothetical protein